MIKKSALTGLTKAVALNRFNEASSHPGVVAEMIEQDDGLWTVTVVFDDTGAEVTFDALTAFDETGGKPIGMPKGVAAGSPPEEDLGSLSRRFESNGQPGAIGFDNKGGFSYGAYQIATRTGTMSEFLKFVSIRFPAFGNALEAAGGNAAATAGSDGFRDAWRGLASGADFLQAQHAFIAATHYEPFAKSLRGSPLELDLQARTPVMRDVAWSTSVQHGPANRIFLLALNQTSTTGKSDRQIITSVYAERSKVGLHFPSSSASVKAALITRFQEELALALSRLP